MKNIMYKILNFFKSLFFSVQVRVALDVGQKEETEEYSDRTDDHGKELL